MHDSGAVIVSLAQLPSAATSHWLRENQREVLLPGESLQLQVMLWVE